MANPYLFDEWKQLPVVKGNVHTNQYPFIRQFYAALDERVRARQNGDHFFRVNFPWASGTIGSVTPDGINYVLQDDAADPSEWDVPVACGAIKRWIGFDCDDFPAFPANYDVIIYADAATPLDNEVKVLRASIIDDTFASDGGSGFIGTLTVRASDLDRFASDQQHVIDAVSDIEGCRYEIIKRDGLTYADRLPPWPNEEHFKATIVEVTADFDAALTTIRFQGRTGDTDAYADKELITYAGGKLCRFTITSNSGTSVVVPSIDTGTDVVDDGAFVTSSSYSGFRCLYEVHDGGMPDAILATGIGLIDADGDVAIDPPNPALEGKPVEYTIIPDGAVIAAIIEPGFRWRDRRGALYQRFYTGASDIPGNGRYWTRTAHAPTTGLPAVSMAFFGATNVVWDEPVEVAPDVLECRPVNHPGTRSAMDVDLWSDIQFEADNDSVPYCPPGDHSYSPWFFRSWRAIQSACLGECVSWVEPKDWTGLGDIHNFTLAEWFSAADVNHATSSVAGSAGSSHYFFVASAYYGQLVYYTILDAAGKVKRSDQATADASGKVIISGLTVNDWNGFAVTYSAGYTRVWPRRITRVYPCTVFDPDDDGMGSAIYPPKDDPEFDDPPPYNPNHDATGQWITKEADDHYLEYTEEGHPTIGPALIEGDLVRYLGTPENDPPILDDVSFSASRPHGYAPDTPYLMRLAVVKRSGSGGTITASTRTSVTIDGAGWWEDEIGIDDEHVEFTPTTVTTTSVRDTTKSTDNFWIHPERGYWTLHVLKILQPGAIDAGGTAGPLHGVKRIVSAYNSFTRTLTFDAIAGLSSTYTYEDEDGDSQTGQTRCRLLVPAYEMHRWRHRTLRVTVAGDVKDIWIQYNDDDTLWFDDPGFDIPIGTTAQVIEHQPGGVWKYTTSTPDVGSDYIQLAVGKYLVRPVGADPRGGTFATSQTAIEPTRVIGYGLQRKGDYVQPRLFNEVYRGINELVWLLHVYGWTANGETNTYLSQGINPFHTYPTPNGADVDLAAAFATCYADFLSGWPGGSFSANVAPKSVQHSAGSAYVFDPSLHIANVGGPAMRFAGGYAYATINGLPTHLNCAVSFMGLGWINSANVDEGVPTDWPNRQENSFNSLGTGLLFRQWAEIDSIAETNIATRTSATKVGPTVTDPPTFTPFSDPLPHATETDFVAVDRNEGFFIGEQIAIVKFDVPGGFKYVSP